MKHRFLILLLFSLLGSSLSAQDRPRVYRSSVSPNWFADNTHFWYRNDLAGGKQEYVLVDAVKGVRKPAFDHERLAKALGEAGVKDAVTRRRPLDLSLIHI